MERQKDFQRLKRTFYTEVLEVYDARLRGNYFIHQHEPNCDGKGINYNTGGRELAVKGANFLVPAVNLYATEIAAQLPRIQEEYHATQFLESNRRKEIQDKISMLSYFNSGVDKLSDELYHLSQFTYIQIYPAISHFSKETPQEYRQGLGEMIFHQLRLLNMCHLGESDPFQFNSLDNIFQLIPDKDFLSEERTRQLGVGLVKEVLKSKNGCRVSAEARQAIQRYVPLQYTTQIYAIQNEVLIDAIDKMEAIETKHVAEMDRLKKVLEKQQEDYIDSRKHILSAIGEEMHMYDYRD